MITTRTLHLMRQTAATAAVAAAGAALVVLGDAALADTAAAPPDTATVTVGGGEVAEPLGATPTEESVPGPALPPFPAGQPVPQPSLDGDDCPGCGLG